MMPERSPLTLYRDLVALLCEDVARIQHRHRTPERRWREYQLQKTLVHAEALVQLQLHGQVREPRSEPEPPEFVSPSDARRLLIRSLIDCGATGVEVGTVFGFSRQRAQMLYGEGSTKHACPLDVLAVLRCLRRDATVITFQQALRLAGAGVDSAPYCRAIRALGMESAVRRLLKWRRDFARRTRVLRAIQRVAEEEGRTPLAHDFCVAGAPVVYEIIMRAFGSFPAALMAAGFAPNALGGASHGKTSSLPRYKRRRMTTTQPPRAGRGRG